MTVCFKIYFHLFWYYSIKQHHGLCADIKGKPTDTLISVHSLGLMNLKMFTLVPQNLQ